MNDFTFQWEDVVGPSSAAYTGLMTVIEEFYTNVTAGGQAVSQYLSGSVSRDTDVCSVNLYRLPAEPGLMGSPVAQRLFTAAAPFGTMNLPAEVAVCNSIHADLTGIEEEDAGTRPRARRRGRQFIGPLRDFAMTSSDTDDPAVTALFQTTLTEASQVLLDAASGLPDAWQWSVFSRTEWVMRAVVGGWVDNAFDTIRSRGQKATARTTWVPL